MKKYTLSLAVAFLFCVAATVSQAQGTMGGSQGTSSPSSPSGMGRGTNSSPAGQNDPMAGPNQTGNDNTNQTGNNNSEKSSGEKKMKGCVQSQGGQYVLETKKGKMVNLTGQDVSAHVGHEVQVKGTWASGTMSQSSTGNAGEKTLNVTDVKMISDTCSGKGSKGDKDRSGTSMGPGANGNNPQGTGSGSSSPAGSGTGSQPPQ